MWRLKFTRQFSKPMQTILMKTKLKDPTMKNKIPKQNSFFMKPKIPSLAAMICCLMFLATDIPIPPDALPVCSPVTITVCRAGDFGAASESILVGDENYTPFGAGLIPGAVPPGTPGYLGIVLGGDGMGIQVLLLLLALLR